MDGQAYLEKLISDRLRAAREQPEGSRGASINLHEIRGIATGLVAAGVLRQLDADRLLTDLRKTMERAGWIQVVTQQSSTVSQFGPQAFARIPGAGAAPARTPPAVTAPHMLDLRRVVPLVGRTIKHGDVTRIFISLEIWNELLIIRSAVPREADWRPDTMRQFFDGRLRWRAWDDQGTQYRSTSVTAGGGSGTGDLMFENRAFFPSPPEEADLLTVIAEHPDRQSAIELPLH